MVFSFLCCGSSAVENAPQSTKYRRAGARSSGEGGSQSQLTRNASKQFVLLATPSAASVHTPTSTDPEAPGSPEKLDSKRRKSSVQVTALEEIEETVRKNNKHVSDRVCVEFDVRMVEDKEVCCGSVRTYGKSFGALGMPTLQLTTTPTPLDLKGGKEGQSRQETGKQGHGHVALYLGRGACSYLRLPKQFD